MTKNMGKTKKILIIDDDEDFVEATKIVLESELYNVSSASGPDEGFKKVFEEKPDLIVLDVMLPDRISGFEMCRRLKKDVDSKNIPILMVTALDGTCGLRFENVAGDEAFLPTDKFINKPVDTQVLLSKVKELLIKTNLKDKKL